MKTNYFKVDRSIQNHWLWEDKPFSKGQAWIDLLLLATHTDNKIMHRGKLVNRKRGEVHISTYFLAERWGWSRNRIYRFFETLEYEKMITTNGTTDGTIITIENYSIYQSPYTTNGTTDGTTDGTKTIKNNKDKELLIINKNDKEPARKQEVQTRLNEIRNKIKEINGGNK